MTKPLTTRQRQGYVATVGLAEVAILLLWLLRPTASAGHIFQGAMLVVVSLATAVTLVALEVHERKTR